MCVFVFPEFADHLKKSLMQYFDKEMWSKPMFVFVHLGIFFINVNYYSFYSFLPSFLTSQGIPLETASYVMAVAGVATTSGRLFVGWFCL